MEELEEAVSVMTAHLKKKGITGEEKADGSASDSSELIGGESKTASDTAETIADGSHNRKPEEDAAGSFVVKKAIGYMQENYTKKLTLIEVADHTYVSQWHLSKLLNRHTGQSFSEHLNTIRITEAQKLLSDPSLRIGDIAELVGFVDVGHFSRVFKKIMGMSANEYRNRM